MTIERTTVEAMRAQYPRLSADLAARGFAASVVCKSPRAACIWYETVKGGRVLAYGSKALFERAGRDAK